MKENPETKSIKAAAGEVNEEQAAAGKTDQNEKDKQAAKAKKAAAKAKKKAERQERREVRRHKFAWAFFKLTLTRYFIRKFRYSYDSLKEVEGPYLVLANHNMELDPALVGIAAGRQIYFVASEHIMRKGLGTWFLRTFFRPIIHTKGKTGAKSVMAIIKALKKGHNVCLFAEGNRSFSGVTGEILPATGKLARAAGASLVTFRIEGGYLTQPRFSTSYRKGKTYGHLVHVYKPEELRAMSDNEMNEAINRDLFEDAYAVQDEKMIPYKGKDLTKGIESTLFYCPACHGFNTLSSMSRKEKLSTGTPGQGSAALADAKDLVRCACGFEATYNVYGYLECSDGVTRNMRDWDREQHEALMEAVENGTLPAFRDRVTIRPIDTNHRAGNGTEYLLTVENGNITLAEEAGSAAPAVKPIPLADIAGLAIYSRNHINVIYGADEQQYDVRGDIGFNALKYMYLRQMYLKETES